MDDFERHVADHVESIGSLVRIPTVSAPGYPESSLREGADVVARLLAESGLEHAGILELPGAPPYVHADWLHAENAPTVLFYSHYDVQPAGREEELDSAAAGALLVGRLTSSPPFGAQVEARVVRVVRWWRTNPRSPEFSAARRALATGYCAEPLLIAAGGSIGFADAFARVMGDVPCLLLGIEDPACNAHSHDESLSLDDWRKCGRSIIHLLHELRTDRTSNLRDD